MDLQSPSGYHIPLIEIGVGRVVDFQNNLLCKYITLVVEARRFGVGALRHSYKTGLLK